MKKKFYRLMILLATAALGISACANKQAAAQDTTASTTALPANATVAEGHLKPERAVNLVFRAPGVVEQVNVEIGDEVSEGDVLVRMSNASQAEAQLAAAKLELVTAQQELDTLNRTGAGNLAAAWTAYMDAQVARAEVERRWEALNLDDIDNRIEDADAEGKDREQDLKDAQEEFDKYKDLDKDNAKRKTAEDKLETAQNDYNEAVRKLEEITRERDSVRAELDSAKAIETETKHQYDISSNGVNTDQLALGQARLEDAQAQVAAAESNLSNFVLTAPFDGVVADVAIETGDQVESGWRAVSIINDASWMVETTDITELEVVNIAEGQKVTFTADALPDITMQGVVSEISQSSYTQSGDVIYAVRIKADAVDPRVKWGMTVEVTFEPLEN
jgi:HlyD family secretion protein